MERELQQLQQSIGSDRPMPISISSDRKIRYVDLFCGCGGMSSGLSSSRQWECVLAADYHAPAVQMYSDNFPTHPVRCVDLAQPLEGTIFAEVVVGGPPCVDYTYALRSALASAPDGLTSSPVPSPAQMIQGSKG